MAEMRNGLSPVDVPGIRVSLVEDMHVASLRHFDLGAEFSSAVHALVGVPLPGKLCAAEALPCAGADRVVLVWRGPNETLLLCDNGTVIDQLSDAVATLDDGCVIDLTGGAWVLRASGEGVALLFERIGGQATLPGLGEARRSRLAEIPVLASRVRADEILLIVERVYAEHLMEWIRRSTASAIPLR
jgi:heterotetrameric sarcosine oxidase gamma subunit